MLAEDCSRQAEQAAPRTKKQAPADYGAGLPKMPR